MSSSKPKTTISQYYLSFHLGVCLGVVDYISEVFFGDKSIFRGKVSSNRLLTINKPDLFGGEKREGGAVGTIEVLLGDSAQKLSSTAAGKLKVDGVGLTADTAPGFRGMLSLFFRGAVGSKQAGFYVGANSPYLKDVKVRATRIPKSWYPEKAAIGGADVSGRKAVYILFQNPKISVSDTSQADTAAAMKKGFDEYFTDLNEYIEAGGLVDHDLVRFYSGGVIPMESTPATTESITSMKALVNNTLLFAHTEDVDVEGPLDHAVNWFSTRHGDEYTDKVLIFIGVGNVPIAEGTDSEASYGLRLKARVDTLTTWGVKVHGIAVTRPGNVAAKNIDNTSVDPGADGNLGAQLIRKDDFSSIANLSAKYYEIPEDDINDTSNYINSNPAHIILECLTNDDWGMGHSITVLDQDKFAACADVLHDEGFGLSLIWTKQMKIEDFVNEILDHINGVLYLDPATGLICLRLLRASDTADLTTKLQLTPENCSLSNIQRRGFGELVNEIVVTWTNPATEKEETVTAQDLAGITIQGGVVSSSRNYYGVRTQAMAYELATRDLTACASPVISCDAITTRAAWSVVPGDIVVLSGFTDLGIDQFAVRVLKVDYGRPGAPEIKLSLLEDVYSRGRFATPAAAGTYWTRTTPQPRPADFVYILTLPFYMVAHESDQANSLAYPSVYAGVLAATNTDGVIGFTLSGVNIDAAGTESWGDLGDRDMVTRATLATAMTKAVTSFMPTLTGQTVGDGPQSGGFAIIGLVESTQEVCLIRDNGGALELVRGALDTVPQAWPAGTPIWFVKDEAIYDTEQRAAGESISFKVRPTTSSGTLLDARAPLSTSTLTERPHLPNRPGNVRVNGSAFNDVDLRNTGATSLTVTWSNRNRLMEDSTILLWNATNVTPESGQTAVIEVCTDSGVVLGTIPDLTGTSHSVLLEDYQDAATLVIKVWAERAGLRSLQAHSVRVLLKLGYGYQYGMNYGG